VSRARVKCHVFVDFDGTIAPCDATDMLFEQFADPSWRDVEEDWQAGEIGSRECMTRQVSLLRATPQQLVEAASRVGVDRGFSTFVRECTRNGFGMTVVSDGFDIVIDTVLRSAGLRVPFHANHLEPVGSDRWRVTFPSARSDCRALAGNCKCSFTEPHSSSVKVVVGDGRSDFCIAGRADLVFAKGKLLELCRGNGTTHVPFADFFEVTAKLGAWLNNDKRVAAPAAPAARLASR
jgi:2-hydroxy-3-keto-5-methylthiopentenyl-1-phosphate phosphatase